MDLDRLIDLHQSTTPGPWEMADGGWGVYITARDDSENVWAREQVPASPDVEFAVEAHLALPALVAIAKAAKEYQAGMFQPGSGDLTKAWTALCAALAGVE